MLRFAGGALAGPGVGPGAAPTAAPVPDMTYEMASAIQPITRVRLAYPSVVHLAPGNSATLALVISNTGSRADSYAVSADAVPGWLNASALPPVVALQPGASQIVEVLITAPQDAVVGTLQPLAFKVQSRNWAQVSDSGHIHLYVETAPGALTISASDVVLPAQNVGQSGWPSPVVLTNTGSAAIGIASITASGDFSHTTNCGTSLNPARAA